MYPYNIFKQSDTELIMEREANNRKPPKKQNNKRPPRKPHQEKPHQKPENPMPKPNIIDEKILDMILEAISEERGVAEYYATLMKMARSQDEKNILNEIRIDEQKHEKIFRRIYYMLTGKEVLVEPAVKTVSNNIRDEYKKSIFEELEMVEFYKKLYIAIKNQEIRIMLYDVITDEQSHAIKLTYLNSSF